jgi:hypothetical protein
MAISYRADKTFCYSDEIFNTSNCVTFSKRQFARIATDYIQYALHGTVHPGQENLKQDRHGSCSRLTESKEQFLEDIPEELWLARRGRVSDLKQPFKKIYSILVTRSLGRPSSFLITNVPPRPLVRVGGKGSGHELVTN